MLHLVSFIQFHDKVSPHNTVSSSLFAKCVNSQTTSFASCSYGNDNYKCKGDGGRGLELPHIRYCSFGTFDKIETIHRKLA